MPPATSREALQRFGPFELDGAARELRMEGKNIRLQPRIFDVLRFLVWNRDRVVPKEELLNTLWPDVIVTDASLQRAISQIRAALRKGGWEDAVETHSRVGYRFRAREHAAAGARPANAAPIDESAAVALPAAGTLLERDAFLVELSRRFHAAEKGAGQAVFIAGEAGVGKSALITTFLATLGSGPHVLRGYCDALFTPRAFGAILDVATQLAERGSELPVGESREKVFGELLRRLQAAQAVTVIVLEDLHWADDATLDFVRFLGRRLTSVRCLLVASYRDEHAGTSRPLGVALGDLGGPPVAWQRLPPLSPAAVAQLARTAGQDAKDIYHLTGGNPFLVRELLTSPADGVPATVRDSMQARLARCSAGSRRVCELVALLPGRAEIGLVASLLANAQRGLDEAVARGVIVHEEGFLSYRHELARQAVENLLPPAGARRLHARILQKLRSRKADPARLVHHARCAGDRAAILKLAPEAARRAAALGAHREAAAHFAAALLFADELKERARLELLEGHAFECYLTSQIAAAIASATAALALWRGRGDRAAEGRSLRFLSRLQWFNGDRRRAEHFAHEAVAVLAALPPGRELAMAYSNLAQLAMLQDRCDAAVAEGRKAVALARRVQDVEIESHALNNIGTARLTAGDPRGLVALRRSLKLALAHNLHEHAARAYVNLASGAMRRQLVPQAREMLRDGLAYCEERDLDAWTTYLRGARAQFDLERGDWDAAAAAASRLIKNRQATPITRIPALVVLARIHLRRGEAGAAEWLDEAQALARATQEMQRIGPVAIARAEAAWLRGEPAAAAREAEAGLSGANESRDAWLGGALHWWRSLGRGPAVPAPPWIAEPYRLALSGRGREAAEAFAAVESPYEQALALAAGDRAAREEARAILTRLGAVATLRALDARG